MEQRSLQCGEERSNATVLRVGAQLAPNNIIHFCSHRRSACLLVLPSQVILQVVTASVFLAAIAHTVVLMVCTGWRYTLAWYDPLFPAGFSAIGMVLLYLTIADAILIQLRPDEDVDTVGYWMIVIFGLMFPMGLAGPTATLQMVLYKFERNGRGVRVDSLGTSMMSATNGIRGNGASS